MADREGAIATLVAMGYPRDDVIDALDATHDDVNLAVEWLSVSEDNDNEFDLMAGTAPAPAIQEPTVFRPRMGGHEGVDQFAVGVENGTISQLVDARIQMFTDMGFTTEQAEAALRACNNDVNEALTLLLSE